ncbi:MAG: LptE family protein [Bacteroidales bacterium]|nr:LptE family protein [Bacteroidales bacterium]
MKFRFSIILIVCLLGVIINGCTGGYSFTGADIDANIKTVQINYFPNQASLVQPNLSNVFTESLKDKFQSQTNLELVSYDGDLVFEGMITNYTVNAQAFQGNETAALNRLTITVKVKYTNNIETAKSFETSFTRYSDFDSKTSLSSVENDLIQEISTELVTDIFNKAVANW